MKRNRVVVLNFLFRLWPRFWIVVEKHDPVMDEFLLDCMEKEEYFSETPDFLTYFVRGIEIWTGNYPHCYGGLYTKYGDIKGRAGAYVSWKLKRYLDNQRRQTRRKELGM